MAQYSCQSQLVMLTEEILEVIDHVLLDFSKAFDSVPHKHLIQPETITIWNTRKSSSLDQSQANTT